MDYIPYKRAENKAWWTTLKESGAVELAKINLPAPDIAAAVATATDHVAKMQAMDDAEAALNAARAMKNKPSSTTKRLSALPSATGSQTRPTQPLASRALLS